MILEYKFDTMQFAEIVLRIVFNQRVDEELVQEVRGFLGVEIGLFFHDVVFAGLEEGIFRII